MPPPKCDVLEDTVLPDRVNVPAFQIPPPSEHKSSRSSVRHPLSRPAEQSEITLSVSVKLPALRMHPPCSSFCLPLITLKPMSSTVASSSTEKTRCLCSPFTVRLPSPFNATSLSMTISARVTISVGPSQSNLKVPPPSRTAARMPASLHGQIMPVHATSGEPPLPPQPARSVNAAITPEPNPTENLT